MTNEEAAIKLAAVEQRAKSNTRRVEKLELQTEAIQKLATSVEVLVMENKHQTEAMQDIREDVAKLDGKVDAWEKKPGKKWEKVKDVVLSLVLGAIAALVFSQIGLG